MGDDWEEGAYIVVASSTSFLAYLPPGHPVTCHSLVIANRDVR